MSTDLLLKPTGSVSEGHLWFKTFVSAHATFIAGLEAILSLGKKYWCCPCIMSLFHKSHQNSPSQSMHIPRTHLWGTTSTTVSHRVYQTTSHPSMADVQTCALTVLYTWRVTAHRVRARRSQSQTLLRRMRETAQIATWGITVREKFYFFFIMKVVKNWNRDLKRLKNILEILKTWLDKSPSNSI